MSATSADVTLRPLLGWIHPADGEAVDPAAVLAHLRRHGIVGSVQSGAIGVDEPCTLVVLVDDVERVQVVRDGRVGAGAPVTSFAPALGRELEVEVLLGDEFYGDVDAGGEDTPELPDVALCRVVDSALPLLAHTLGPLDASVVDRWTILRFEEEWVDVEQHGWLGGDLPLLVLRRNGRSREIQVVTRWNDSSGHALTREPDLMPAFTEMEGPAMAALTNPHLAADSDLRAVLAHPRFRHLDLLEVASVLQSAMDDGWSARVLTALGLPSLAADVHEGRAELPDPTHVGATSLGRSLVDTVLRYYDAPHEEVRRRTPYGKLYDRVQRHPVAAGAMITTEVAASVAALAAGVRPGRGTAARTALLSAGVVGLLDATMGAVLATRRFRRRRLTA
ncbi:hypothetical protein IEQ44_12015 [Nocardioides sp. Y6]|uniref:Uncharacterized protein n=1 Tax=Nocardioides malaquae TaxID=2773426 RepID=A0ABR9RW93_9ACTN|nr:hypothetical protein [Nocardioides malaquae]MBE7325380.1 hypothetical protein [Nocardioides malaquae]